MKKILLIAFILIFSTTAYANNRLDGFNKWLFENGYSEYVKKVESAVCKTEPKYSNLWYYNKCDQPKYENNLKEKPTLFLLNETTSSHTQTELPF